MNKLITVTLFIVVANFKIGFTQDKNFVFYDKGNNKVDSVFNKDNKSGHVIYVLYNNINCHQCFYSLNETLRETVVKKIIIIRAIDSTTGYVIQREHKKLSAIFPENNGIYFEYVRQNDLFEITYSHSGIFHTYGVFKTPSVIIQNGGVLKYYDYSDVFDENASCKGFFQKLKLMN